MKNQTDFKPMLLLTVNNSIGNKNKHLSVNDLINIFNKKDDFSNIEKYAIDIIQTEADLYEILDFVKTFNISKKKKDYIMKYNPY